MTAPNGWKLGRLGQECSIEIGGTPARDVSAYWDDAKDSTNLWVSIRDLNQKRITRTNEQITDSGVRNSNVKLQPSGTVLLSFKLTIGRVAIAGAPLYTNEAIAGIRSKTIAQEYLYYGLQQWNLLSGVDQAIKGATLNKEKLRKIEFEFPESDVEQSQIASVLARLDNAIERAEAVLAKQKRIRTGMLQDLLTRGIDQHGRIRSERTHAFKDSPIGRIPVEWDAVPLKSVAEFVTSGSRGWARYYAVDGAMFLRIGNLTRDHINLRFDDVVRVTPPKSSEGRRTSVSAGDLLISITADLGIIGVIPKGFEEAYVNQHIALVRVVPKKANSRFLGWFLCGRGGQSQFERLNESGAKAGLNLPTIERLLVPTTRDPFEQERIVNVLDATTRQTDDTLRDLEKLHLLKTGLMQDLLTGRKRVTPLLAAPPEAAVQAV
jgi:type I restriction enzyme S subunit